MHYRFAVTVVIEIVYGPDMAIDSNVDRIIELTQAINQKVAEMGDTSFVDLLPFCELCSLYALFAGRSPMSFDSDTFSILASGIKQFGRCSRSIICLFLSYSILMAVGLETWHVQQELEYMPFMNLRHRVVRIIFYS